MYGKTCSPLCQRNKPEEAVAQPELGAGWSQHNLGAGVSAERLLQMRASPRAGTQPLPAWCLHGEEKLTEFYVSTQVVPHFFRSNKCFRLFLLILSRKSQVA